MFNTGCTIYGTLIVRGIFNALDYSVAQEVFWRWLCSTRSREERDSTSQWQSLARERGPTSLSGWRWCELLVSEMLPLWWLRSSQFHWGLLPR